jgi:hypothetical protein
MSERTIIQSEGIPIINTGIANIIDIILVV